MNSEPKICAKCTRQLAVTEFYEIRSKDGGRRFEKICKSCKRAKRNADYQKAKPNNEEENSTSLDKDSKQVRIREEDGAVIYKEYLYPNGEVLQLTKEEFDRVVEVFQMLWDQDRKINGNSA